MSDTDTNELMAGGLRVIGAFQWRCKKGSAAAICINATENIMHFAARTQAKRRRPETVSERTLKPRARHATQESNYGSKLVALAKEGD